MTILDSTRSEVIWDAYHGVRRNESARRNKISPPSVGNIRIEHNAKLNARGKELAPELQKILCFQVELRKLVGSEQTDVRLNWLFANLSRLEIGYRMQRFQHRNFEEIVIAILSIAEKVEDQLSYETTYGPLMRPWGLRSSVVIAIVKFLLSQMPDITDA